MVKITNMRLVVMAHGAPGYMIAARANIHPSTLSNYMNGRLQPTPEHLARLAEVLDCEVAALMGYHGDDDYTD